MNENFAKLVAIGLVAGVAKALFGPIRPITNITQNIESPKGLELVREEN